MLSLGVTRIYHRLWLERKFLIRNGFQISLRSSELKVTENIFDNYTTALPCRTVPKHVPTLVNKIRSLRITIFSKIPHFRFYLSTHQLVDVWSVSSILAITHNDTMKIRVQGFYMDLCF